MLTSPIKRKTVYQSGDERGWGISLQYSCFETIGVRVSYCMYCSTGCGNVVNMNDRCTCYYNF